MAHIRYLEEATDELQATIAWILEHGSAASAADFAAAVTAAVLEIAEVPLAWPVSRLASDSRPLRGVSHSVYADEDGGVAVVAIAHMKRRPGYWRARLK